MAHREREARRPRDGAEVETEVREVNECVVQGCTAEATEDDDHFCVDHFLSGAHFDPPDIGDELYRMYTLTEMMAMAEAMMREGITPDTLVEARRISREITWRLEAGVWVS